MISDDEIKAKFDDLRKRRLSQRREKFLTRCPRNCEYNVQKRVKGNGRCGFCTNPVIKDRLNGEPFVCQEKQTAERCRLYECRNTPESVEKDFERVLRNPARCGEEYPKLAILIWCIQDSKRRTRWQRFSTLVSEIARSVFNLLFLRWY